jgi:hypothetical protein
VLRRYSHPENLEIKVPIPRNVLQFLGDLHHISEVQEEYFRTINPFFPMISTKLLQISLHHSHTEPRADFALLLVCMKLITSKPMASGAGSTRSDLYLCAKSFYLSLELEKRYSTHFLQSGLLISLYEYHHGVYPEAQISVTRNSKLAMELGLHELESNRMNPAPMTWAEEEERNRIWWSIVILDR